MSRELTKYRMLVVDKCTKIRDIEEILQAGIVEELIWNAHNELKLLRIMKEWQPWDYLFNPEEQAEFEKMLATLRSGFVFPYTNEPTSQPTAYPKARESSFIPEGMSRLRPENKVKAK